MSYEVSKEAVLYVRYSIRLHDYTTAHSPILELKETLLEVTAYSYE